MSNEHLSKKDGITPFPKKNIQLAIANHASIDLHVQVSDKADWGPGKLFHGDPPITAKTRDEFSFGSKANFHIKLWRNNNGEQGEELGEFDHDVRYNALGWTDELELVVVNIRGERWLHALSARKVGEIIFEILLG
ncbi:hypothetical protein ACQGRZ_27380 [Bacillus wiedmannii]|uniref:hypothetical protein n=1 Tax=Bacillus wiedmannii TaxID=1890302 RepID=UPI003CEAC3B1